MAQHDASTPNTVAPSTRRRMLAPVLVIAALVLGAAWVARGPEIAEGAPTETLVGYVETDLAAIASPAAGWLMTDPPEAGAVIAPGDTLFELDRTEAEAALDEAKARLRRAEASAADLASGDRAPEIEALEAKQAEAEAAERLAAANLDRAAALLTRKVGSEEHYDAARADLDRAQAQVAAAKAAITVARLGGRDQAQIAAAADVDAARAAVAKAEWALSERRVTARAGGRVEERLRRRGEHVSAGAAVLAFLPKDGLKIRFFVSQATVPTLAVGDPVSVQADGLETPIAARISFIAREAEFTPPVIYSAASRDSLVFLVEARPDADAPGRDALKPGLPVDVMLTAAPAGDGQ